MPVLPLAAFSMAAQEGRSQHFMIHYHYGNSIHPNLKNKPCSAFCFLTQTGLAAQIFLTPAQISYLAPLSERLCMTSTQHWWQGQGQAPL